MAKNGKFIAGSKEAYSQLKIITDAAQAGKLSPWGGKVIELLNAYGIVVDRRNAQKAEVTISFPTSTDNRSMGVGVKHLKTDGTWAEDFFLFEEDSGLTSYYRGAQEKELPEYKGTHHGQPTIALQESLPGIQQEIDNLKIKLQINDILNSIDMSLVVNPANHKQRIEAIDQEYHRAVQSVSARVNGADKAYISMKLQPEFTKKRTTQMQLWQKSENIYKMKNNQIADLFTKDSEEYKKSIKILNDVFGK